MQYYFIKTFGCQQNIADSERLASYYRARGFSPSVDEAGADLIVINTCLIRDKAEERVYGYIRNLERFRQNRPHLRIVMTGCIVGAAAREPSGVLAKKLSKRIPHVELMPIEDVGFEHGCTRTSKKHAWVVISHGCNNYCSFCIVPFARGKEVSRPYEDILSEVRDLIAKGYQFVTLLGQNVNSYGSDIVLAQKESQKKYVLPSGKIVDPVFVKHLGRMRIPTLFPYLLDEIASFSELKNVTFISSNPWDFSDELIDVIARHENIDRFLHLPVQSGSDAILKKMNRWYTREEYMQLIERIRERVLGVQFATDIIVGFPGETEEDFAETLSLCREADFHKVFIGCYSPRPGTVGAKNFSDEIPLEEKKRRFRLVNDLVNKAHPGIEPVWLRVS
ncbi:MAG: MiaB/RimO family radical SAM methylthiotransferase [Candidatus Moranbacteria bacterium]|nr:MiaB/RimO family radical SAM methylthiotransferase [Candidatus Moranbacteria bacterium]